MPPGFRRTARTLVGAGSLAALVALSACGSNGTTGLAGGTGTLVVRLTDAPFPFDSIKSVDAFVVRIDAKLADVDSAEADSHTAESDKDGAGWTTVAEPEARIDLLTLRDGTTATLGQKALPAGTYKSFRLIVDPAQSDVTLKNGQSVEVAWPSAGRSGIKIQLDHDVVIGKDATQALLVDFDVSQSFVMRGSAMKNGLLFKPVIRAKAQ